jgi:hypothetical protein
LKQRLEDHHAEAVDRATETGVHIAHDERADDILLNDPRASAECVSHSSTFRRQSDRLTARVLAHPAIGHIDLKYWPKIRQMLLADTLHGACRHHTAGVDVA